MDMRFESQRELLEYLNKNVNDRSLIQRMMKRGEVYKEDGGYYLVEGERGEEKSEVKESVKYRVEVDENELEDLRRKNEKLIEAYKNVVEKYNRLVDAYKSEQEKSGWELCNHLIFFYRKFQEYKKFVEGKVFGTAEYNKREKGTQDTMESVRPDVYARYNFEYGEIEEEECKAVEKIIAKRDEENASLPF